MESLSMSEKMKANFFSLNLSPLLEMSILGSCEDVHGMNVERQKN